MFFFFFFFFSLAIILLTIKEGSQPPNSSEMNCSLVHFSLAAVGVNGR